MEDACHDNKSIRLDLINWHPSSSSIYFLSVLHRGLRHPYTYSEWTNGCPDDSDFGCEGAVHTSIAAAEHQICVPASASACDLLPSCGQDVRDRLEYLDCHCVQYMY